MGVAERKGRERVEREQRIVAAARLIATREGWGAVTIRRLADEIEYSQPVLYSHFKNRDAIVAAVVVGGFQELGVKLQEAANTPKGRRNAPFEVGMAYLTFARQQPALYEAMFAMPIALNFAQAETRPELKNAFSALGAVVPPSIPDREIVTETFWAAIHGLAQLEHSGRIRPTARDERLALVIGGLLSKQVTAPK